ncbi:hypothetical protein OVV29_38795, partial [Klebsiella pneumoniae]|nr:hypothetical protein [Klebsiella pneumoniae]
VTVTAAQGRIAALYGQVRKGGDVFLRGISGNTIRAGYGLGQGEIGGVVSMLLPYGTNPHTVVDPNGVNAPFGVYARYEVKS